MRPRWIGLLVLYLMTWEPIRIAGELQASLGTLSMRGMWAVVELLVHVTVAAVCVSSAWALWIGNAAGPQFATIAVAASAAVTVQSLFWSRLPQQTVPGEGLLIAALALAHAAAWIAYLKRSRRVRAIYG